MKYSNDVDYDDVWVYWVYKERKIKIGDEVSVFEKPLTEEGFAGKGIIKDIIADYGDCILDSVVMKDGVNVVRKIKK